MNPPDMTTTIDLIKALTQNIEGAEDHPSWESFSIVISFYSDGRISSTSGYAYSPDGTTSAIAVRPSKIMSEIDAYMSDYFKSGEQLPIKLLVQFDRSSGNYTILFEDTDEMRWKVTPANIDEIIEALRPNLGATKAEA